MVVLAEESMVVLAEESMGGCLAEGSMVVFCQKWIIWPKSAILTSSLSP